jgi:hypothetical protein
VLELMRFGAVYHSAVMPMPNERTRQQLGEATMLGILAARQQAMALFGTGVGCGRWAPLLHLALPLPI